MIGFWLKRIRRPAADEASAFEEVQAEAMREIAEALGDRDAFVPEMRALTDGLLLGVARSSSGEPVTVRLPWDAEYAHWLVQGGTGTGKTTWIVSLLEQELRAGRPVGIVDCKGDLFDAATRLVRRPGALRGKRVVVFNPFSDRLVPMNVCRSLPGTSPEAQYEVTLALSRLFESSLGSHMESILRHLVLLLMEAGLSLVEAPLLLEDEVLRGVLAVRSKNTAVADFFLRTYPAVPQVSKDALQSRLQGLLLSENLRLMLGADAILDLRDVMNRGDILLAFLGKGPGVPEEQVEILGGLFLQLIFQATYARGTGQKRGYLLAIDEFFHLLESPGLERRFATALTTTRSFGLSLMLIHHNFSQLPPALREIVLANCDLVALFRTSGRTASLFGDILPEDEALHAPPGVLVKRPARGPHEALQQLPDRYAYWYDRRKPYRALRLCLPDRIESMRVREACVQTEDGAVSREELRRAIEERRARLRALLAKPPASRATSPSAPKKGGRPSLG